MSLPAGTRLGPYEILSPLGAGGMGEVYRARDSRLGRDVAIKVLPEESHSDPERLRRFEQEAKAAGALNHPNLLAVYDVGTHDGSPYIVSELLEGETLRQRVRSGELSPKKALELAVAIARGLSAVHAKGIVHRDLKPVNVFLTKDGQVKILDFGLAKLARREEAVPEGETASQLTDAGSAMGTAGYMSPEQIRGQTADHRSDIFSLGVVLHEMVTGKKPFRGETGAEVMTAILREDPPELSEGGAKPPPGLERIVKRCLEKRPEDRFHSAHDLALALEATGSAEDRPRATAEGEQASIVVLPFENLSPDPDNAFFADGLTDELIAELSKVRALRVISRTSAMLFKGAKKSVPTIARELNVRYALEGSVRRAGSNVRITAQLIDASTDAHAWAERYAGTVDDVFDLQEKLARRIVDALKVTLTPEERRRLAAPPTSDPRAYQVWLRARHEALGFTKEGLDRALQLINQALAIVGDDALLYAALGYFGWVAYDSGFNHDADTLVRAEAHATKALDLNPELSQALLAVGLVRYKRGDMQGWVRHAKRAVELDRNSDAGWMLGFSLSEVGRTAEAYDYADEALARDPLTWATSLGRAVVDLLEGRFEEALARFRDSVARLAPGEPFSGWWLGQAAAFAGRQDEARMMFGQIAKMGGGLWSDFGELGLHALLGDRAQVREVLDRTNLRQIAKTDEYYPTFLANCLARVGETDEALRWLEQAVSWGFTNHRFLSQHNRFLAPLRGDSRFQALIDRAREKERAFEV